MKHVIVNSSDQPSVCGRVMQLDDVFILSCLCRLVYKKIPKGHFTHIFIDKAEAASETECLIPLAGKKNKQKNPNTIMFCLIGLTLFNVIVCLFVICDI